MHRRAFLGSWGAGIAILGAGCLGREGTAPAITDETLRLTTTTSTYDTGILAELHDVFESRFGVDVQTVAQGTGAALETARAGDADVVLAHARSLEDDFIEDGYGINRRALMFNDFVLVGPVDDPANVGETDAVETAFERIAATESEFFSRGDNSGTHLKERELWERSDIEPSGAWYQETGSGMGEVLTQATMVPGYTLVDRGTYLTRHDELDLAVLLDGPIEGGPSVLANPYGIIAVNPGRHDHVSYDLAMAYIGFLTSRDGYDIIAEYTVDGEQLFFPDAIAADPRFEQYVPSDWQAAGDA